MTDLGITVWDVIFAITVSTITSPAFIFAAMGLCVVAAFALLIGIVLGGSK